MLKLLYYSLNIITINMKNNNTFKLILIIIFGFLLRIWFLDKPEGFWYDEYLSWQISSQPDLWLFFQNMVRNCHTPLYYLYLKLWMFLFNDTDTILRYSSVIPSTLSIAVMYFVGRTMKNNKLGYLCAITTTISSFLIYFSQELRPYSLLFLFTSLSLLYTIKVLKNINKKDLILFFIFNVLIVLTHTLGFIYVFILLIFSLYYILDKLDDNSRKKVLYNISIYVLLPLFAILIVIAPFLYNILTYNSLSQFWTDFNFTKVILTFTDYFSPIQANVLNTPDSIFYYIYQNGKINYIFIIFAIIPSILGFIGIINTIKIKNKIAHCLLIIISVFYIYLILISYTGRMVLITKYSAEIYPSLILLMCYGLYRLRNKKIRVIIISSYLILNLFYIFTASDSAQRRTRPEGHRCVVELLRNSRLKQNDFVLLTYYDKDKFERYLTKNDNYNFYSINKFNFNYFLYNDPDYKRVINSGSLIYRDRFKEFPNKNILSYSINNFQNKMKRGDRIGIIYLNNVSFLSNENIQEILNNKNLYNKTPFIFLVFSTIKNSLMASFKDNYRIDSITHAGDWTLVVYLKTKD